MKQITRDLYTSGRVWLSLSHSFSQNIGKNNEFDLVTVNGDFVTLNAGALFVLSFWSTGGKTPYKFYIPEYKIEEFRLILSSLRDLKNDEKYIRDGELTEAGKSSVLYYRLTLANKKYIDLYFVENDYNGDKSINIAIQCESNVYPMYDSNVIDLIDIIPTASEIVKYKQSAAELYYIRTHVLGKSGPASESKTTSTPYKKSAPRTVTKVDRTSVSRPNISEMTDVETKKSDVSEEPHRNDYTEERTVKEETQDSVVIAKPIEQKQQEKKSGYDYSELLEDD